MRTFMIIWLYITIVGRGKLKSIVIYGINEFFNISLKRREKNEISNESPSRISRGRDFSPNTANNAKRRSPANPPPPPAAKVDRPSRSNHGRISRPIKSDDGSRGPYI